MHIIIYDLDESRLKTFEDYFKEYFKRWARIVMNHCYCIHSNGMDSSEVRDILYPLLKDNDRLLVIPYDGYFSSTNISKEVTNFLKDGQ